MKLFDMRRDYSEGQLRRQDLKDDPIDFLAGWFEEACRATVIDPNAVSLATTGPDAMPLVRTVLIKQFDSSGFVFFTNYESRKARHIAENPHVSFVFPWLALQRQVIVTGVAQKLSASDSIAYFAARPVDAQLAAWASHQSHAISSRAVLEMTWADMKRKFAAGKIPIPPFWGGFRIIPATIEFWQGRMGRLHDRFLYTREDNGWRIERLAP